MIISHYQPSHDGNQPIRVLQHNIIQALEQTNDGFVSLSASLVEHGTLNQEIDYNTDLAALNDLDDNEQRHKPYLKNGRDIHVHESFLSYLWCICYALVTIYEEEVAKPDQNRQAGALVHQINRQRVQEAYQLFAYARSLVVFFEAWPTNLPSPERHEAGETQWIEVINGVFTAATSFVLLHEFAHSLRQHGAQKEALRVSGASLEEQHRLSRDCEREADEFAVTAMQQGYRVVTQGSRQLSTKLTSELGTLTGLCALIFMAPSVAASTTHPSLAERIDSMLQALQPAPDSQLWGIACVALHLWAEQFGHQLALPPAMDDYQQLYATMLAQARAIS